MRFTQILALLLAFELFVSSIGIAQVSHVCKMAINASQTTLEVSPVAENHDCCQELIVEMCHTQTEQSCCTNLVRYFHNNFNGTFHEFSGTGNLKIVSLLLFNHNLFFDDEIFETVVSFLPYNLPPDEFGRELITSIQSFLI